MKSEFENWHSNSKDKSTSSAFAAGWMCQQSKVDDLQKQVADLDSRATKYAMESIDVAKKNAELQNRLDELTKQRDSFIKAYQIEMDESVELQKRVDDLTQAVLPQLEEMKYPTATFEEVICCGVKELEQALKGGSDE